MIVQKWFILYKTHVVYCSSIVVCYFAVIFFACLLLLIMDVHANHVHSCVPIWMIDCFFRLSRSHLKNGGEHFNVFMILLVLQRVHYQRLIWRRLNFLWPNWTVRGKKWKNRWQAQKSVSVIKKWSNKIPSVNDTSEMTSIHTCIHQYTHVHIRAER